VLVCSYVCRWSVFHCGYASIVFCGCCWLCSNYVCADLNFLGTGGVRLCCVEPVTGYMVFCNALGPGSFGPETLKKNLWSSETAARHPILIPVPVAAQGETSFHPRYIQPKRRLQKDGGRFDDWGGGLRSHLPSKLDEECQLNLLVARAGWLSA
jgi:hypothetical protein